MKFSRSTGWSLIKAASSGVHSLYAKKPNEDDVQIAMPDWPNDTIVSFQGARKPAAGKS